MKPGSVLRRWQEPLLGRRELPADISDFELSHAFTFDADELKAIRSRRSDRHRLAAALHIGFIKTTGTMLAAFDILPPRLLRHLSRQLQIKAPDLTSLCALYGRRQTLFEHQSWAARVLGFSPFSGGRRGALRRALRVEAQTTISADVLVGFCNRWLFERRVLIPSATTLRDISRECVETAEAEMFDALATTIPEIVRRRWLNALLEPHPPHSTMLEWLQGIPKRRSTNAVGAQLDKLDELMRLKVNRYRLDELQLSRVRLYAASARRRKPARLRVLAEPRRSLETVCLMYVAWLEMTDMALVLADMRGRDIVRQAQDQVAVMERRLLDELEELTGDIEKTARDETLSDADARKKIIDRLPRSAVPRTRAARLRYVLSSRASKTRPLVKKMLRIKLCEAGDQPTIKALSVLRKLYEKKNPRLPKTVDVRLAPRWRDILEDKDRARALRGFEAATLESLRDGLRSGAIWAPDSVDHRSLDELFIAPAQWRADRHEHYRNLKLPKSPDEHLDPVKAGIAAGLKALAAAVDAGEVSVSERGVHLKAIEKEETPKDLEHVRKGLFDEIGPVQLPDLIVEMDSMVGFSSVLLGRPPRSRGELLTVYCALLAQGTSLSPTEVALMVRGVEVEAITSAMLLFEDETALREANARVVDFLLSHTIAKSWGDGTLASADAMNLEASRLLWNARIDPRHRRYAVGTYTHLLNQWGIIYDQPIVVGQRQAGVAIEGAVRQTVCQTLMRIAVDTHGFTDFAMCVAKFLSLDLCPRLQDLSDRRLHVPRGFAVPRQLVGVVDQDIARSTIHAGYDGLVRVAASIKSAGTSAELALARYGAASRRDPVYRAGSALGKLHRTLFLCDFFTNEPFRRELLRVLNYGETIHTLQRALYRGSIAPRRGRRRAELVAISGSLTLLTNLTMAWWAHKLQDVLDRRGLAGHAPIADEILRHVSPVHFEAMNLRGLYTFPIAAYAHRLFAGNVTSQGGRC